MSLYNHKPVHINEEENVIDSNYNLRATELERCFFCQ